jgi:hypothetical protein
MIFKNDCIAYEIRRGKGSPCGWNGQLETRMGLPSNTPELARGDIRAEPAVYRSNPQKEALNKYRVVRRATYVIDVILWLRSAV